LKKSIILLSLLFFLFQTSFLYSQDTVKGGYTSCTVYEYSYKLKKVDPDSKAKTAIYKYNANGNKTEKVAFGDDGGVEEKSFWTYDEKGKEIGWKGAYKSWFWTRNNGDEWVIEYAMDSGFSKKLYNDQGRLIEEIGYQADSTLSDRFCRKYDDKGNEIEYTEFFNNRENWYEGPGATFRYKQDSGIIKKEYDDTGNLIKKSLINMHNSADANYTFKYDKNGNMIEEDVYYNRDSSSIKTTTYKYDDKGKRIEEKKLPQNGSGGYKITFKYDDKGNLVEEASCKNKEVKYKYEYKYDDMNKKIEETINYGHAFGVKYSYTYDKDGNKIEEVKYSKSNEPETKTEYIYSK
jgi:YD repeat-containing protein